MTLQYVPPLKSNGGGGGAIYTAVYKIQEEGN